MNGSVFLNTMPIVGFVLGIFLMLLLLSPNRTISNRKAWWSLFIFLLLNTHFQLDSFLMYNGAEDSHWVEWSYLHHHLSGLLIFLFTVNLFGISYNKRLWIRTMVFYSILRFAIIVIEELLNDSMSDDLYDLFYLWYVCEYYLSILINVSFFVAAYLHVKKARFAVKLNHQQRMHVEWMKGLLLTVSVIYIVLLQNAIASYFFEEEEMLFLKLESIIASFVFFAFAYFAIRFPIFSIRGDFKDLSTADSNKYTKSSLDENKSENLWKRIYALMEEEQVYRNPEYRLNDLADACDSSVHHISQLINEQKGISYTEFINQYRVKDAMHLLKDDKAQHLTILGIAYEVGFNSKTAFYNAFKKINGQTPSAYKNS